eukprot:scpid27698/ scgid15018/ 
MQSFRPRPAHVASDISEPTRNRLGVGHQPHMFHLPAHGQRKTSDSGLQLHDVDVTRVTVGSQPRTILHDRAIGLQDDAKTDVGRVNANYAATQRSSLSRCTSTLGNGWRSPLEDAPQALMLSSGSTRS